MSSSRLESFPSPRDSSTAAGPNMHIHTAKTQTARFWSRSRAVAPASSGFFDDHATDVTEAGEASEGDLGDDPNARDIIFISKPNNDFLDLRSILFGNTTKQIPVGSNGAVMDVADNGPAGSPTGPRRKRKTSKRRLRAKEELCLTLPRDGTRPKRSWFLGPGLIGREGGEHILVATKDPSMDPVHAEVLVDGDDYLVRDHHSTGGTFLCLSTIHRHYPQRDGFRLRRGDSFFIGLTTKVTVEELVTELAPPDDVVSKRQLTGGCILGDAALQGEIDSAEARPSSSLRVKMPTERQLSSRMGSRSSSTLGPLLEANGEVENADADTDKPSASKRTATPTASPRRRVRFADAPPGASDGSIVRGTRYQRTRSKPKPPAYPRQRPVTLTLTVTDTSEATASSEPRRVRLSRDGSASTSNSSNSSMIKEVILLGTSAVCDVQLPAEDIHPVHARIVFDGFFFLLQDLSFDENPLRKTRVELSTPTRIARGDTLLLGKCELHVTTIGKAFRGRDRDMKEVAIRCRLLRVSKRKTRAPSKFVAVGFRNQMQESFVFGKGRDCNGQLFTTALAVEQFSVQLDHGACMMTPKAAGINQGTYFLLGRDSMPHATKRATDLVRYSSKALMLVEGCVFKCGNTELEVVLVKHGGGSGDSGDTDRSGKNSTRSVQANDELFENSALLADLPWLQQIAFDKKMVQNIARRGRRLAMDAGGVIYDEGDPATFLFIVVSGDVELLTAVGGDGVGNSSHYDDGEQEIVPRRMTMRLESMSQVSDPAAAALDDDQQSGETCEDFVMELVPVGSFFGEICLHGPGMEYTESARASGDSGCVLLVFDREDLAGYLGMYMDIIRPHLALETEREILHCLRLHVPWLSSLSYNDMRMLAARAERLEFTPGELVIDNGRLLGPSSPVPASSPSPRVPEQQQREGLLLLVSGKALLTRPVEQKVRPHKRKVSRRHSLKALAAAFAAVIDTDGDFVTDSRELRRASATADEDDAEALGLGAGSTEDDVVGLDANLTANFDDGGKGEEAGADNGLQEEWWRHAEPLVLLPSTTGAASSNVVGLQARSRVECFFLDAVHVAHLATVVDTSSVVAAPVNAEAGEQDNGGGDEQQTRVKPLLLRKPTQRRSSFAAMHQRLQSSQIITKALNSASGEEEDGADDTHVAGDSEDDGPSRKWRRKKRNRNVLEKTLAETQADPELPSALVLYVLSGGNRGDVHVVRNVATIGALKSGADIELNDRYVSPSHAVIEHHDGRYWLYDDFSEWGTFVRLEENNPVEIHPGDIFLAGEVEFMCLGAFPERKKSISCCLQ